MFLPDSISTVCAAGKNHTFVTTRGCLSKHIPVYFPSQYRNRWRGFIAFCS